jgi:hypothetical protein
MKSNEEVSVSLGCTCFWASKREALLLAHRALDDTTRSMIVRAIFRSCMMPVSAEQVSYEEEGVLQESMGVARCL